MRLRRDILRLRSRLRLTSAWQASDELRRAVNKGTLRAFRNADRFTTFKIFRWPGALRRRLAPGQLGRSDRFRETLNMFVLVRAVTYAALFIGVVLVYLPGRFLSWSGIVEPATTGAPQVAGMIMVTIGTVIALWCVFTFVFIGKGTPAPFDPPRKLVIRRP